MAEQAGGYDTVNSRAWGPGPVRQPLLSRTGDGLDRCAAAVGSQQLHHQLPEKQLPKITEGLRESGERALWRLGNPEARWLLEWMRHGPGQGALCSGSEAVLPSPEVRLADQGEDGVSELRVPAAHGC